MSTIGEFAGGLTRLIGNARDGISDILSEPVIRLGVTGLSRAGKTVFITSLVANLIDRGRMPQLRASAQGRIEAAFLQPQPDDDLPRFDYEHHLADMTGPTPVWPLSTRSISQLRLSFRVQGSGLLSGMRGPRTVHLDIVDYPGEWLLDLPLMDLSFAEWSAQALTLARSPARAAHTATWLALNDTTDAAAKLAEPTAQSLAAAFTASLANCRAAGLSAIAPGRFLMPGDLQGSPALTFAPLTQAENPSRNSLWREFDRRYEAYKRLVILPFFRNHFSRIDRQVVLVDALTALQSGPQAVDDLRQAMTDILLCFRPGTNSWLAPLLGRKVERILFAATKADALHHSQHNRLASTLRSLLKDAEARAGFSGARTQAMAIASLRSTVEETTRHKGREVDLVKGIALNTGKPVSLHPGDLPEEPGALLRHASEGAANWADDGFVIQEFLPPANSLRPGMGPPHIRLDRAAEFLFGDRL